jgi:S-DNA-T family DNA segregation ATPase FtsK/SpoIIIE
VGITLKLGYDEGWGDRSIPLDKAPHLLVAGMTGSGKSVFTSGLIADLITNYAPSQLGMVMVDPKRVELAAFRGIPHLVAQPVYAVDDAKQLLWWAVGEMNRRYEAMGAAGVRNLAAWNEKGMQPAYSPLLIVIDELANLILADKTIERPLVDIASMGRAAGIHMILATQRPSADVMTGLLRANVPTRISFMVQTAVDSRIMLDETGAEKLHRPGEMLIRIPRERTLIHAQGAYVSDDDIDAAVARAMQWPMA